MCRYYDYSRCRVSTHSRPKAAGYLDSDMQPIPSVSTHSRPKAAGKSMVKTVAKSYGFNTQPPEGGWDRRLPFSGCVGSFNTQPPEGGWEMYLARIVGYSKFQHTAARRRLVAGIDTAFDTKIVSTHSRPKAAG